MIDNDLNAYPWTMDLTTKPIKVTNAYGIYLTTLMMPPEAENESLAIKAVFRDRTVKIHWNGRIEVEETTDATR